MGAVIFLDLSKNGEHLLIKTPFSRPFVDDFKASIHPSQRYWDHEEKVWGFALKFMNRVIELLNKHFPGNTLSPSPAAEAAMIQITEDEASSADAGAYMTLGIRVDCPNVVVHGAFMALLQDQLVSVGIRELARCYAAICKQRNLDPVVSSDKTKDLQESILLGAMNYLDCEQPKQ